MFSSWAFISSDRARIWFSLAAFSASAWQLSIVCLPFPQLPYLLKGEVELLGGLLDLSALGLHAL